jgi:hypothetical protein
MKTTLGLLFIGLIALSFFIVYRAMGGASPTNVQAAAIQEVTQYVTPTFRPTETPVPTSTIGYEATIYVAQATADEARRVNAQATAQHEANILSILQITSEAERRSQEILSWTAQAAPTVIPLTATQQAVYNTQSAQGQMMVAAMMTATMQAPTQYAAIIQLQDTARYSQANNIMRIFALSGFSLFLWGLAVFLFRWQPPAQKPPEEPQIETVVQMRKDNGGGTFQQTRLVVPCAPEQLTELAEMAANQEKKFGINRLETGSRTFRGQRSVLIAVREFLLGNGFVISDGNGTITLNADGEAFLAGWFDHHQLPTEYEFASEESPEEVQA